ncbi:MAG: alpha/beta hydrolase-fold protein, partial [Promethearchaeota archaeon]
DKNHRILIGASMGGAGTLRICLLHPKKFIAAAALSSGNIIRELIGWEVLMPLIKELFGEKVAKRRGKRIWADILDTFDLVLSKDNPLLPSIQQDEKGKIISLNKEALNNWLKYDINQLIKEHPNALKEIHLLINSDHRDEMGSAIATEGIHKTLDELGIPHQFELYEDPKAYLSPHILGIAYHILPAIQFSLQFIN